MSIKRTLLFFIGRDSYFLSHRLPTARAAIRAGYDVHVIAADSGLKDRIEDEGFIVHPRWLAEDRVALLSLLAGIIQLIITAYQVKARIIQVVGLRYAIAGLLSSLFLPWTRFIFSINGLGFLFAKNRQKIIHRIARRVILSLFTIIATVRKIEIAFQNDDDLKHFTNRTTLRNAAIHLIRGSGVDTDTYTPIPLPVSQKIVFGVASRMIKIKGINDIIKAFRHLIDEGVPVKLVLAGDIDAANPDSLSAANIQSQCRKGEIEWLGYVDDMAGFWAQCHVAMLGSHGGEGLPMSLLIPAAMARPIICSDTSGNRDLVDDAKNGYLCPAGDVDAIKTAVTKILDDDLVAFGMYSRTLIHDRQMDAQSVARQFAILYQD